MNEEIRKQIADAIKYTFGLTEDTEFTRFSLTPEIYRISGFPHLLTILFNKKIPPKLVAQALENVIVHIKQKEMPTPQEIKFNQQIQALVYAPQYQNSEDDIPASPSLGR